MEHGPVATPGGAQGTLLGLSTGTGAPGCGASPRGAANRPVAGRSIALLGFLTTVESRCVIQGKGNQ
jgi:hypothetical protein